MFGPLLTVTDNDEILETERGNSSPSFSSKQKKETQTEPLSRKKKIVLTSDSMGNGISEKPDDLIVHGGTNDTNVKKSSIKFLKNHHQRLSHFHASLTAKTRRTSRKL